MNDKNMAVLVNIIGAVEGVLPDQVQGAPLQGIDLVVDEDVAGAGEGEEELVVVVEMQPAHVPGVGLIEGEMKFCVLHGDTSRKSAEFKKICGK